MVPTVMRKDYTLGVDVATGGLDEPDQKFYENYVCGAERNYTGYCDKETDKLIDAQSMEANPEHGASWSGISRDGLRRRVTAGSAVFAFRHMHAAARQGPGDSDQQPLQWMAHGRRLARSITNPACGERARALS